MSKKTRAFGKGFTCVMAAGAVVALTCTPAFGTTASNIVDSSDAALTTGVPVDSSLMTTMGARAGSAGPDFLGISNMNYDFQPSHTAKLGDPYPYDKDGKGYGTDIKSADHFNRLAIWTSGANTNANPYYQNLLADAVLQNAGQSGLSDQYTKATTYHSNTNSWGDVAVGDVSVISENYKPSIIFGANKTTNWLEGDYGSGTKAKEAASNISGYNPSYANNDSTNIWTQIYTMQQLAGVADNLSSTSALKTRYNNSNASASALAYEKSIKGQMLYVASQLETNPNAKKKVAYLYAIDGDKAYFFVPQASGLTTGSDTGSGAEDKGAESANQDNYAANNSTINMGYMATLPFITDTFGANKGEGTVREGGIQMIVEDIYKKSPAVTVDSTNGDCLTDVDVIIYNSTTQTGSMNGTKNGLCTDTDINNTYALNDSNVQAWAQKHGFNGSVLAGDDYGTSTKQSTSNAVGTFTGSAPMLYCARNYTVDKNARAAWAFSKVYPELYGNNDDASYAYWVENVYHIKSDKVTATVAAYTHQSTGDVTIGSNNTATLDSYAEAGYKWYQSLASNSVYKTTYAYYNGSSRASYYSNNKNSEEPSNTIGIFAPSTLWTASETPETTPVTSKTATVNVAKVTKKAVKAAIKKAGGNVTSVVIGAKAKTIASGAFKGIKKVTTVTIGKNVKKIGAKAFKGSTVKTVILKTKKLAKKSAVKNAFKGSKVKTAKVNIGKKKVNKKFVKKYKKVLTKKIAGKKLTVKA